MSEIVLSIKRQKGTLRVTKDDDGRFSVSVSDPAPVTKAELDKIEAVIGGEDDGARLVAKFRARMGL